MGLVKTIITFIIVGILASILLAWPVQLLWNYILVDAIQVNPITFWQALGLNMLAGILFKSNINIKKD